MCTFQGTSLEFFVVADNVSGGFRKQAAERSKAMCPPGSGVMGSLLEYGASLSVVTWSIDWHTEIDAVHQVVHVASH